MYEDTKELREKLEYHEKLMPVTDNATEYIASFFENFGDWAESEGFYSEYNLDKKIECTTGPLGQGFATAVGMAIAEKHYNHYFTTKKLTLFDYLFSLMENDTISSVKIVYPEYTNMLKQTPVCKDLFNYEETQSSTEVPLFVPDRDTVIKNIAEKIFMSVLYKRVLETALGAQAATLTAMRSAYDTACEYSSKLETEMNRKRQSQVTADVIEISSEFTMKGDI